MLNSIVAGRERVEDGYNITLTLPEKEYFDIYDDLDEEAAEDILRQYMLYHGDEGRYSDVKIECDKNIHIVNINAKISYSDNDHTKQFEIPSYFSDKI